MKKKKNKWDLIKHKNLSKTKQNTKKKKKKEKRKPIEWEKIFANYATDKSLIPQIYKQCIQFKKMENKQNT